MGGATGRSLQDIMQQHYIMQHTVCPFNQASLWALPAVMGVPESTHYHSNNLCLLAWHPHRHYRKVVVAAMPQLNHLDDMPVRDKDHRLAAAFLKVWCSRLAVAKVRADSLSILLLGGLLSWLG
jgi:hypothetical protein